MLPLELGRVCDILVGQGVFPFQTWIFRLEQKVNCQRPAQWSWEIQLFGLSFSAVVHHVPFRVVFARPLNDPVAIKERLPGLVVPNGHIVSGVVDLLHPDVRRVLGEGEDGDVT